MALGFFSPQRGEATPRGIDRQQALLDALMGGFLNRPPQNVGEGLSAVGQALAIRGNRKRLEKQERELADYQSGLWGQMNPVVGALMGGQVQTPAASPAPDRRVPQQAPAQAGDNTARVYEALLGKGYPGHVAAGLVGNMMQESGPNLNTSAIGDGGNSFGMAQWNGPRREALMQFASARGADPADPMVQVEFLHHEMQGPESAAAQAIMAAPDAASAARIASEKFWRPGEPMMDNRVRYAEQVATQFGQPHPQQAQVAQAGGMDPSVLMSILSDPRASDEQRQFAGAMLQSVMERNAPLSPLDQAKLGDIGADNVREDARLQLEREKARTTGDLTEYDRYVEQEKAAGREPLGYLEYQTALKQAGASTNIGSIPQGYELTRTSTGMQLRPIPGGPAEIERQQVEAARESADTARDRYGGVVLEDIGRVRERVEASPWMTTGLGGSVLREIPGTGAYDVRALTDTIRSNIGFDRLQQMRESSPTGGALGQVTERELAFLQATLGNLEQSQSQEQFMRNLDRLEQTYLDIVHGPGNRPGATTAIPEGVDPEIWEYLTPEERKLWQ